MTFKVLKLFTFVDFFHSNYFNPTKTNETRKF